MTPPRTTPPEERHLEFVCGEALRAFQNGDLAAGIRNLGHGVYIAGKGGHGLADAHLQRIVSTVTSAGAEAAEESA